MQKIDDSFEIPDTTPESSNKLILWIIIVSMLLGEGFFAYYNIKGSNYQNSIASIRSFLKQVKASSRRPSPPAVNDSVVIQTISPASDLVIITTVIPFNNSMSLLESDQNARIRAFYEQIKDIPGIIQIDGYTDNQGLKETGLMLSQRRADAVSTALKDLLIGRDKHTIVVSAHGEDNPVGDNATASGRQANRRVELKFTNNIPEN